MLKCWTGKTLLRGKNQNMLNQTRLKETTYVKKKFEDTKGRQSESINWQKRQKDKQRSTKHTHQTKDRVIHKPH
jgi:hypothetical protein